MLELSETRAPVGLYLCFLIHQYGILLNTVLLGVFRSLEWLLSARFQLLLCTTTIGTK